MRRHEFIALIAFLCLAGVVVEVAEVPALRHAATPLFDAQGKARTITLTFTATQWEAATRRVGTCAVKPVEPAPGADVSMVERDCESTIAAWAHKRLMDDLAQELTTIRLEKASALEEVDAGLKALDANDCAAVNAALKARKKAPLPRCGGGSVP